MHRIKNVQMLECCQEKADQFSLEEASQAQIHEPSNQNAKMIPHPLEMTALITPPQTQMQPQPNLLLKHIITAEQQWPRNQTLSSYETYRRGWL